jgi:DNA-nicking Smr family endonuclease
MVAKTGTNGLPSKPDSMAERKRSSGASSRARPARPALREQLKAVSRELRAKKKKRAAAVAAAAAAAPAAVSFAQLARGVQPLPEATPRAAVAGAPASPERISVRPHARLWVEQSADAVRAWAADVPPRVVDALEAGRVVPRRELDLHRKSAVDAREALVCAVREARQAGVSCLLVVCGRGKHSDAGGPVLPEVAVECLSETLAGHVLAFVSAPRKWGGKGALLVRLRPASRRRAEPSSGR